MSAAARMAWVALFAVAFALVEASVVIYLRSLYYPAGFEFPLRLVEVSHLRVELARELATILMLGSVGVLAGTKRWERFGYFLVAFGVWDIFYYIWLRVFLGWPASPVDWDVLFLIPLPWIGPVIAPVAISAVMIAIGSSIILRMHVGLAFRPGPASWGVALAGTAMLLYSFMSDTGATLGARLPGPYAYWQLVIGLLLYGMGYALAVRSSNRIG